MTKILATTNLGNFTIELEEEKAPLTCENFLSYVRE
jgi:peptidyl-prolyl cis-trans isomerase A (cyclophilin A)